MSYFATTHLVFEAEKALVVSGPHFHVLNVLTGDLIHSTTRLAEEDRQKLCKSGPVRCVAVGFGFAHVATTGDDKQLKVWSLAETLRLESERELPKKPTEVSFTRDGQTIVISDKFGDVFSYPLVPDPLFTTFAGPSGASKRGSLTAHENPSNGTLVLGHASMLTTFSLTPDERYIITADRDEHIRVSWFPQGYAIERYCLGHEKFVSAIHIPPFQQDILVSGGGDSVVKVWDWMSGKLLADIHVFPVVEPYITVKAPKRRRGWSDGDGDGDAGVEGEDGPKNGKGKGRRSRRKGKAKGKVEAREESTGVETPETDAGGAQAASEEGDARMADADANSLVEEANHAAPTAPDEVLVFVIRRLSSVNRGEHGRFILFNVIGATALFYASFPDSGQISTTSVVHAVDFGVPVINFTVGLNGDVWTLLDAEWTGAQKENAESPRFVRLLTWNGATLTESSNSYVPLLTALNSTCLVPAMPEELKALELYSDLSAMPKNVDPEHDPLIRDTLSEAAALDPEADGKQLTQRELGRLKKKKALLAKIQEKEQLKRGASETAEKEETVQAEAGREIKRTRSESDGGQYEIEGDVKDIAMDAS